MPILNPPDEFGFTNDPAFLAAVEAFRDAAVSDGWAIRPTYTSEPQQRASTLEREGFKMSILTRTRNKEWQKYAFETHACAWGPDGLALRLHAPYSWEQFKAAMTSCNYCGATGVQVERVGFAGRCCAACIPTVRPCIEYPGWTR